MAGLLAAGLLLVAGGPGGAAGPLQADAYAARGELAGQWIDTRLDSDAARRYLEEHHLGSGAGDPLQPFAEIVAAADRRPLDAELLRWITGRLSTDFAALYFTKRLYDDPRNRAYQRAFGRRVEALEPAAGGWKIPARQTPPLFVFVPGYAYRLDPATGAGFRRQRELMERSGFATRLLETDEAGTVEANAAFVARELARLSRRNEALVVVSASKGGAEVALALGGLLQPEETLAVRAWISIGGLLRGTPLADRAGSGLRGWLARLTLRAKGLDPAVIESLDTRRRRAVFTRLRFPPHLLILHYVAVPLSGQVSRGVRGRYRALAGLGPNDGLTLLADEIAPGGITVTALGLDHYYRDPRIDLKTLALATIVLEQLAPPPPVQGPSHP